MITLLIVIQFILAVIITIAVLLQKSSSIGLGAYSGSNESLFGAKGPAGFLTKFTFTVAIIFVLNTLLLGYQYSKNLDKSIVDGVKIKDLPQVQDIPLAPIPLVPQFNKEAQTQESNANEAQESIKEALEDIEINEILNENNVDANNTKDIIVIKDENNNIEEIAVISKDNNTNVEQNLSHIQDANLSLQNASQENSEQSTFEEAKASNELSLEKQDSLQSQLDDIKKTNEASKELATNPSSQINNEQNASQENSEQNASQMLEEIRDLKFNSYLDN